MHDNEGAQVYNQGKARLDYGYGITFTLYNDTSTGGTSVSTSGQVKAKLAQGGLLGHNPAGTRTEVQLPNGGSVVILGTTYFIGYDAATGTAWVYNFDGTVRYSVGGGPLQDLPAGNLVVFNRSRVLDLFTDLRFPPEEFDRYATDNDSPIAGLEALMKDLHVGAPPPPPPTVRVEPPTSPPPTEVQNPVASLTGAINQLANCRYGPGAAYLYKYGIKQNARMKVIGRDTGGHWLQVTSGNPCWINAKLVNVEGDIMQLADAYPFTTGLPISPFFERVPVLGVERQGQTILVRWAGHDIRSDLRQEGVVEYIVEVWTCVDGRPGFFTLGTDETSIQFQIDESCGVRSHADVIGQDKEGFSPPAEIALP
jgi:hypothetical protein